jgi:DhnA family fructose-bisphosphate aldolase class Ia
VARATTLPILLLGGESAGDPTGFINELTDGMKASNVRGALVGRNVLYPGDEDPLAAALAVSRTVHAGIGAKEALDYMAEVRGTNLDVLKVIAR